MRIPRYANNIIYVITLFSILFVFSLQVDPLISNVSDFFICFGFVFVFDYIFLSCCGVPVHVFGFLSSFPPLLLYYSLSFF